jgi:hypothetical protein
VRKSITLTAIWTNAIDIQLWGGSNSEDALGTYEQYDNHVLPQCRCICSSALDSPIFQTARNYLCQMSSESWRWDCTIPWTWNDTMDMEWYHGHGMIPWTWKDTMNMEPYHGDGIIPWRWDHTIPWAWNHTMEMGSYHTIPWEVMWLNTYEIT